MSAKSGTAYKNDTLTFVNEELTYGEVKAIFSAYGEIKSLSKFQQRFFVQFENPEQARKAVTEIGRNYRVTFAHAKSNPRPQKNFRAEGERIRFWDPNDLPIMGHSGVTENKNGLAMVEEYINSSVRNSKAQMAMRRRAKDLLEMARTYGNRLERAKDVERSKQKAKDDAQKGGETAGGSKKQSQKTTKEDKGEKSANPESRKSSMPDAGHAGSADNSKEAKAEAVVNEEANENQGDEARALPHPSTGRRRIKIEGLEDVLDELGNDLSHSVLVINIPQKYTLDEVFDLVEEVKPIAFSEMNYSKQMRVKFCEVFVNDEADVKYLKQKLDEFVICGKQLTVMEPAEILDETRWKA